MTRERVALTKLRLKLYLLAEPSAKNIRHLGPALLTVTKPPFCLLGSLLGASAGSQNDVTFATSPTHHFVQSAIAIARWQRL